MSAATILATTALGSEELIRAIEMADSAAVARLVTDKDAISEVHEQHGTALILAVRLGHTDIVEQLVAAGADVDLTVTKHGCALCEAVRQSNPDLAKSLLDLGANPNVRYRRIIEKTRRKSVGEIGRSPVDEACLKGNPAMLSLLLKHGGDPKSPKTMSAFLWTVYAPVESAEDEKNLRDVIRVLLKADCDPNQGYQWGSSPLVVAIDLRRIEALRILLEECKTLDTNKTTMNLHPLIRAARKPRATVTDPDAWNDQELKKSIDIVRLLVQHGAEATPEIMAAIKAPEILEAIQESLRMKAEQLRVEKKKRAAESAGRFMKLVKADPKLAGLFPGPTEFSPELIATYNKRCADCHGVSGQGLTSKSRVFPFSAEYLSWKSTRIGVPPTRKDLAHVIRTGLPRNKMPAASDLPEPQILALADYVTYLAVINETSRILRHSTDEEVKATKEAELSYVASKWKGSSDPKNACGKVMAASTPESISRGEILFNGNRARCSECHGLSGKGDGAINSSMQRSFKDPKLAPTQGLADLLDRHRVVPGIRNLRLNQSSRQEVYNRIAAGIRNVKMPAMVGLLKPQQISDLADFVLSIADTDEAEANKDMHCN